MIVDLYHNPFGFGIPKGLKMPAILTVHDVIPLYPLDRLSIVQNLIYRLSLSVSLKSSQAVVAISDFTKDELVKHYPFLKNKQVLTIHNGFDDLSKYNLTRDLFDGLANRLGIRCPFIVYVGSATARKNLPNLVSGFIKFKTATKTSHLMVLVSKFNRPATMRTKKIILEMLKSNNMEKEVIFAGYLNDLDKALILRNAELFVYPSLYEGFGLPVLEAASVGTRSLISDIPVFRELYEGYVDFFDPKSSDSIRVKLADALNTESKQTRLSKLCSNFSWDQMTSQYLHFYNSILSN